MEKLTAFLGSLQTCPGARIPLVEFYAAFIETLPARQRLGYPKREVANKLREMGYVVGRSTNNQVCIGNVSWFPALASRPYVQCGRDAIRRA